MSILNFFKKLEIPSMIMPNYKTITTTETYDPHYVDDYESKLKDANICITKELDDKLIDILVRNKDRMILHYTITGLGGTYYEPNVPNYKWAMKQLEKLFEAGFPKSHFVLRLDPIIPYPVSNLQNYKAVLHEVSTRFYEGTKIRCIVSMVDQYQHYRDRCFKCPNRLVILPWNTFHAPEAYFNIVQEQVLADFAEKFEFQCCAELGFTKYVTQRGCISELDLQILGMNPEEFAPGLNETRKGCLCLVKKNCLGVKPSRCPHNCIYCYWKD